MNKTSMIMSAVMLLAFVVWMMPGIFAANRGNVLRNIALWLLVFTALGLVYQNFGPASHHPLFNLPPSLAVSGTKPGAHEEGNDAKGAAGTKDDKPEDGHGFTPPAE
ncbi:MAG: hypothetical protein M3N08_06150 [Pseudomonadota bacterium]|nr:hypothetical protein [Pseudomonadota bacterium]